MKPFAFLGLKSGEYTKVYVFDKKDGHLQKVVIVKERDGNGRLRPKEEWSLY